MNTYWPWWAGAIGLASVTVGHYVYFRNSFGVSGSLERILNWNREREVERADALLADFDFDAALAEFSTAELASVATQQSLTETINTRTINTPAINTPAPYAPTSQKSAQRQPAPTTSPVAAQAVFIAFVFLGGLFASLTSGNFKLRNNMGDAYAAIVTDDWKMWPMLLIGGICVGFGTRLCGGCSSGHGLNGCSRLHPISLLATSVFFGTAVVVSTVLLRIL